MLGKKDTIKTPEAVALSATDLLKARRVMFGFHAWDLLIVLLIALVIFGPRKLPEIGGAIGKSIREFKKTTSEVVGQAQLSKVSETKQIPSPSIPSAAGSSVQLEPEGE